MEIEYGTESEILHHIKSCHKHSRHKEFIPLGTFSLEHLPEEYRNNLLYNFIKSVAKLVVCLKVSCISSARFQDDNIEKNKHPGFGSGWVTRTGDRFLQQSKKTCPCKTCSNSQTPATEWAEVMVYTVKHVVFNTEEALATRCDLFYDPGNSSVKKIHGSRVRISDSRKDTAEITCVTHDIELWEELKLLVQDRDKLYEDVKEMYFHGDHKLVVIVSHPHAQEKHVSLGSWVQNKSFPDGDVQFLYTTPTCTGSSGAPVFILGRDWCHFFSDHPHRGCYDKDLNISAFGPA